MMMCMRNGLLLVFLCCTWGKVLPSTSNYHEAVCCWSALPPSNSSRWQINSERVLVYVYEPPNGMHLYETPYRASRNAQ
ncbi:hypothetical protein J3F83DRAFT_751510 [Trichoderma novae-zelandiae]